MSNLQNANRLSLQTSMANKSKSHSLNNDLLERKTKALEGGLNKLKITTQRDKTKPSIETSRFNLNKGTSQYANSNPRDRPIVRSFSTKSSTIQQISKCGQCETDGAKMKCLECVEHYCANCFDHFHTRGALQRHHYILLPENSLLTSQKKMQSFSAGNNLTQLSRRQANDDTHRQSIMTVNMHKSEELPNEKTSFTSSQQSFLLWRDKDISKSKRIPQKCEIITSINDATVDKLEFSNKLPNIELNSLKRTSNEQILMKTYRLIDKNNQAVYVHRSKGIDIAKQRQPKINAKSNIRHSFPNDTHSYHRKIDIQSLDDDLSEARIAESVPLITAEEYLNTENTFTRERPITHVSIKSNSSPATSPINEDSRSNSITLFPQSLRSILATKSDGERKAIIDPQLNLSHSSSPTLEKADQQSFVLNRKRIISRNRTFHTTDVQSNVIDQYSISRFNLVLDDIVDKSKIELANRFNHLSENLPPTTLDKVSMNSVPITSRRNSPFSFSNSFDETSRVNSSFSRDAGDGEFFTGFSPQPIIPSTSSASNQLKHKLENQTRPNSILSRKSSIDSLSRGASNHSITLDKTHNRSKSQTDNHSQRRSSLLSSALSIAITSSQPDFTNSKIQPLATSSRKNSSSSTLTAQNSASPTPTRKSSLLISENSSATSKIAPSPKPIIKTSSTPPSINTIRAEDERVLLSPDNNEYLEESMSSLEDENPSDVHILQTLNDLSKANSMKFTGGETNTINNNLSAKEQTPHQQIATPDDSSKFRKLEFSLGDGLKWQEASAESMSPTKMTSSDPSSNLAFPRLLTPSNPINKQFSRDTSIYDNDDDRSPRTDQNISDPLDMINSDENVTLNEHVLNNLQGAQLSLDDNDVQLFETQLSDDEIDRQSSFDSELSSYE